MENKLKISTHLGTLGIFSERYVPFGYHDKLNLEKQLYLISKVKTIKGVNIRFPLIKEHENILDKLSSYNLNVAEVVPDIWSSSRWKNGSISSYDRKIRRQSIKIISESMDFAKYHGASSVLLWAAHDGFDYVFQTNYSDSFKFIIESLKEIGEHDSQVKIAIEYKKKDPRQKQFISDTGKLLVLLNSVGLDNVGGALDIGHAFMAHENLSESLTLLNSHKKLFQIHLNDNYKDSDPDLIFGTVNFWENLEFFYHLNNADYKGWLNIDIISPRNDRYDSLKLAADLVLLYEELASRLVKFSSDINKNLNKNDFVKNYNLLKEIIFNKREGC